MVRHSFSARLSLKFMAVLCLAVLVLSLSFLFLVTNFVTQERFDELTKASRNIEASMFNSSKVTHLEFLEIPYYITYSVYKTGTEDVFTTNDPYLPLLGSSNGKVRKHLIKNYYIDGDLNILYFSRDVVKNNQNFTILTAMDMTSDSSYKMIKALPKSILFAIIPLLLICYLAAFIISKKTIEPVSIMTRTAEKISLSNLNTSLPLSGSKDEIDELASTFNSLFKTLSQDYESKKRFTSDVSHELKTPLAVIMGHVRLLERWGSKDEAQLKKSLSAIRIESKSMESIITNLLELSRIENGLIPINKESFDLHELFQRLKEETFQVSPMTEVIIEDFHCALETDIELLHEVLTAIINNSIKYASSKCKIYLKAQEVGSFSTYPKDRKQSVSRHVNITVLDDGPGFHQEETEKVFERFYRGDPSRTRDVNKKGGAGLGLSICHTLVTLLGGKITASNSPSGGAELKIFF